MLHHACIAPRLAGHSCQGERHLFPRMGSVHAVDPFELQAVRTRDNVLCFIFHDEPHARAPSRETSEFALRPLAPSARAQCHLGARIRREAWTHSGTQHDTYGAVHSRAERVRRMPVPRQCQLASGWSLRRCASGCKRAEILGRVASSVRASCGGRSFKRFARHHHRVAQ